MNKLLNFSFLLLVGLSDFSFDGQAQIPHANPASKGLSSNDSLQLKSYLKQVSYARLGSAKRQLYLDSALMIEPTNAYYWQQKAMPLYKAKKYEIGSVLLDSAVKYDPQRYLDYRAFMKCIFQKSYRQAIEDFNKAAKLKGNGQVMDHSYAFYKGLCFLQLNELDSAEHLISKVIENKRTTLGQSWLHPVELFYLAIVYYERGELESAVNQLDQALKIYPEFSDAKYYKALCLKDLGRKGEALKLIEAAEIDFALGYSINEDNVFYEDYPYQIKKHLLKNGVERLKYELAQSNKAEK